jgi:hypothetical protein
MIDEYGSFDGIRIGRGNRSTRKKNLAQCHFVHQKFHMALSGNRTRAAEVERKATTVLRQINSVHTLLLMFIFILVGHDRLMRFKVSPFRVLESYLQISGSIPRTGKSPVAR